MIVYKYNALCLAMKRVEWKSSEPDVEMTLTNVSCSFWLRFIIGINQFVLYVSTQHGGFVVMADSLLPPVGAFRKMAKAWEFCPTDGDVEWQSLEQDSIVI